MAYHYLNTRLRAVGGEILSATKVLELSAAQGAEELISILDSSGYRFPAGGRLTPIQRAEEGIRRRHADRIGRILAMARNTGRPSEPLIRGGFYRWDLHTLKTLLRGKVHRQPPEEVAAWALPGAFFDDGLIRESLRQPTLAHMTALWNTVSPSIGGSLGRRVRTVLEGLREEVIDLPATESALDQAWVGDLLGRVDPSGEGDRQTRRWVRFQVDRINLLTALRLAGEGGTEGGDPEAWFVPGGELIPIHRFREGLEGRDGILSSLPSSWREAVSGALTHPLPMFPSLLDLELRWEARLLRDISRKAVEDPLGLAPGFLILLRAVRETTALRLIVSGIAAGVPGSIREEWIREIYR